MKALLNTTKLEAAKRQLESAILLYFNNCDPVSIHTLSAAAYNILRALNKNRSGDLMLKDYGQFLNDEQRRSFYQQVNEAENFFKHADKDPDESYTLNPESAEAMLAEASRKYIELTEEYPPYLNLFLIWFIVQHKDMFKELSVIARVLESFKPNLIPDNRRQFFAELLPFATRLVGT